MDANIQRGMADRGADRVPDGICAVFSTTEGGYRYVCVSRGLPLRALGKDMNARLSGRGGGSDAMIQGTLGATKEQIDKHLKKIILKGRITFWEATQWNTENSAAPA